MLVRSVGPQAAPLEHGQLHFVERHPMGVDEGHPGGERPRLLKYMIV
jgi:hypothetical protein